MSGKIVAVSFLMATILFVSAVAGTIVYYNGVLNQKDSQIANQNNEIANLNSQISNLTAEVTNLTSANLVSALNMTVVTENSDLVRMFPNFPVTSVPYNSLWIKGSVTNVGHVTAFNVGLHVDAYDDTLEINMTVPLINGVFGTDNQTKGFIASLPNYYVTIDGGVGIGGIPPTGSLRLGHMGSTQLGSLDVGQTANVTIAIYHEGSVSNWTVTPVWTNSP